MVLLGLLFMFSACAMCLDCDTDGADKNKLQYLRKEGGGGAFSAIGPVTSVDCLGKIVDVVVGEEKTNSGWKETGPPCVSHFLR